MNPAGCTADADAERLTSAYRAHRGDLVGFARRRLGSADLAEEAVQETFLRAWRSIRRFDPAEGSERMWLFGICRNTAVDVARRRAKDLRIERAADAAVPDDGGLDEVAARWQARHALGRMSPSQRDAVIDVHLRDRTYAEVATKLGVPVGTIKSRVHLGLRSAREAVSA